MQASNMIGGVPLESLIGHEVKFKINGVLPMAKGMARDYKEFVLAVESTKDQSDYRVYIRLTSSGKTRRIVSFYLRFFSQKQITPVENGETVDVHHMEVQQWL